MPTLTQTSKSIFRVRREYNKWVGNETLEDYALRFTAKRARKWSIDKIGMTAIGAAAFMALEALAATATLQYGFVNAVCAMLALTAVIIVTGVPITYHAARNGLDIDLLTRGAGFGYLGSTITSLIYASFTFIFFAIEAAILASALRALLGIPLEIGYVICVVAVLPIVTHGISAISRFQVGSQSLWLVLQISALALVAFYELANVPDWTRYMPSDTGQGPGFQLALFGACSSLLFALVAQIGEQVDYLRFLPERTRDNRVRWWFWLLLSGPGWILIGLPKMLLGSFLAYLAVRQLVPPETAVDPVYMYQMAFNYLLQSPTVALMLAGVMVVLSQMKINVTNAYAGSIAWSNFFSRLTHSHPGRVVWLVFNLVIALVLMELGIYRVLDAILGIFSIIAISWLGSLAADLLINKPLKLSPAHIEFKRSHLYDINPVGTGSMVLASLVGLLAYLGYFGPVPSYLAHYISLLLCFVCMPLFAWITKGKYYLARNDDDLIYPNHLNGNTDAPRELTCCICENRFEIEDVSHCPAYGDTICSLCCSLDSGCLDRCKTGARIGDQLTSVLSRVLPDSSLANAIVQSRVTRFLSLFTAISLLVAGFVALVYVQMKPADIADQLLLRSSLWAVFCILLIIIGVACWLFLLAHESRMVAQQESNRRTAQLMEEIEAHKLTDIALQNAKEHAERANAAKSRYLSGISHELRTPLQSMLGYAELLQHQKDIPTHHLRALKIMRNSGEHLADLIEGLLEISKIEAGRLDIYRNLVPIEELLSQLVDIFRQQAESKGIELHYFQHDPLPPVVVTDEKRLRQILTNLLSNAIKYTVQGRVELHVNYRFQVAEFSVVDTGVGVHASDLDRILDPFERIRDAAVPPVPGTGLGLTIVRLLTDVLGGNLAIESSPGKGSRFTVSLMLAPATAGQTERLGEMSQRRIIGYRGPRKTALIVDDEAIHRGLVADILAPIGLITFEAQNAVECLKHVETRCPDMLVVDVNMPGKDGLELVAELRRQGETMPILMLSADATEQHRVRADEAGHNGYMTKPIRNRVFLDKIGQLLALEWIYADEGAEEPAPSVVPINPPAHPLMRELLEQAQIGHRRGFLTVLASAEQQQLLESAEIEYLQGLADDMRFDKIEKILDTSRDC